MTKGLPYKEAALLFATEFRMRMLALAAALVIGLTTLASPLAAQDRLSLDDATKAQLVSALKLRPGGPNMNALGQRPVLVTFFASWCPPCAAEFAHLAEFIAEEGEAEVDIIAVNWIEGLTGRSDARLARMINRIHPSIAVIEGSDALDDRFGGVFSVPAIYLFDPSGNEVFRLGGDRGPHGRHFLRKQQLKAALGKIG